MTLLELDGYTKAAVEILEIEKGKPKKNSVSDFIAQMEIQAAQFGKKVK